MNNKNSRHLKVYGQSNGYNYKEVPTIVLKGKWLEAAGFEIGDNLVLDIVDKGLIIKKATVEII